MLIAIAVFMLVLFSGSALCCAWAGSRFEEAVPLTEVALVLVLFLFGLVGGLSLGVYAVLALALAAWALAAARIKKQGFRPFARRFFTPGFWLFLFLAAALLALNLGREFDHWDDFSHWGDVVKMMCTLNVLSTDPRSGCFYPEYPPGISLFQFFLQRLLSLFGSGAFNEGLVYFCYQLFYFSLLLPLLKKLNFRRLSSWLLLPMGLLVTMAFYDTFYSKLQVDPLLGMTFGAVLAWIITARDEERSRPLFRLSVLGAIAMLVLIKSGGALLALLAALTWYLAESACCPKGKPGRRARVRALAGFAAALVPWLLWELSVRLNQAERAFSLHVDFGSLGGLLGQDAYRLLTVRHFVTAFLTQSVSSTEAYLGGMTPMVLFILLAAALYGLLSLYRAKFPEKERFYKRMFWAVLLGMIGYFAGMCLAYMFSFSMKEALDVAAFDRYIDAAFLAAAVVALALAVDLISLGALDAGRAVALLLCAAALVTPWMEITYYLSRSSVGYAQGHRQERDEMAQKLLSLTEGELSRTYVLAENPDHQVTLHYLLRPSRINDRDTWWSTPIVQPEEGETEAKAWQRELLEEYDYVLIFDLAEDLKSSFGSVFADPDGPQALSIYRVNKETGLLELCA